MGKSKIMATTIRWGNLGGKINLRKIGGYWRSVATPATLRTYLRTCTRLFMKSISYTSARSNLAKTMEQVCNDHAPIAITRKGEGAVVMISMDDYQSLEETSYLLRSPKNLKRLISSINELENGSGVERELDE